MYEKPGMEKQQILFVKKRKKKQSVILTKMQFTEEKNCKSETIFNNNKDGNKHILFKNKL